MLRLTREKEVISTVYRRRNPWFLDFIRVAEESFFFVIEARKAAIGGR